MTFRLCLRRETIPLSSCSVVTWSVARHFFPPLPSHTAIDDNTNRSHVQREPRGYLCRSLFARTNVFPYFSLDFRLQWTRLLVWLPGQHWYCNMQAARDFSRGKCVTILRMRIEDGRLERTTIAIYLGERELTVNAHHVSCEPLAAMFRCVRVWKKHSCMLHRVYKVARQ